MAITRQTARKFQATSRTEGEAEFRQAILDHLHYTQARQVELATRNDWYMAVAFAVRDRMLDGWLAMVDQLSDQKLKVVSYFSSEFLMGPHLGNNLVNLGLTETVRAAVAGLGQDLDDLLRQEEEPGLGNGGLGRLAACFLESLATLKMPAIGYSIRYEFGIFDQEIRDGWQVEKTDKWLQWGNPWEICRPELAAYVNFGGRTEAFTDAGGNYRVCWVPGRVVKGIPYDTPVAGYRTGTTDLLRLWKSEAVESFDFSSFNVGGYYQAVDEKVVSETISKVLYPNDEPTIGKKLRLAQQYFFVSCSLQDMLRVHLLRGASLDTFAESFAVQLNDTHPAVAVAELMRLLVDVHGLEWEAAWRITCDTLAYTNHTLLPEALEKWPLPLFAEMLPRPLELIYEINRRHLEEVRRRFPGDEGRIARLSIIDESGEKHVRMAHLACVGSHAVNGVAALHSELLKETVLRDFFEFAPERFHNVTNGVTLRRWVLLSNPGLARLITDRIGDGWVTGPAELRRLELLARDGTFQDAWRQVKEENKRALAAVIEERTGLVVDPASLFDVHGEAAARVQAAAPQRPAHHHPLQPAQARPAGRHYAAHLYLRRQGGAGLFHGQAHHQAHQCRGRGGQCRPRRGGAAEGGLLSRFQRDQRPADLPGGRPLGADLHRRQGGLGDRQHEILPERRPHHRHPRRRQRRDPRRGGRGQFLPLRSHRPRGARPEEPRLPPAQLV